MEMKLCGRCKEAKPLDEFYVNLRNKSGVHSLCKDCHKDSVRRSHRKRFPPKVRKAGLRTCSKCNTEKPLSDFAANKNGIDGKKSYCRKCASEYGAAYYKNNIGRISENSRKWRNANEERVRKTSRSRLLRTEWGMTIEQFDAMLKRQNGGCAVCGSEKKKDGASLHVDHCHSTGRIRGLLCSRCNQALGLFRDDTKLLTAAINYLTETEAML